MDEKELKKLSRQNLIELNMSQITRTENLEKRIEILEQHLRKKEISEKEAGSIIDSADQVNEIFIKAQRDAEQYLESAKNLNFERQKEIDVIEEECARKLQETEERCRQREQQSERYVNSVSAKVQSLFSQYRKMEEDMHNLMFDPTIIDKLK